METTGIKSYNNADEDEITRDFVSLLDSCPIPKDQMLSNIGLFLTSKNLARIKFMDFIYQKIIGLQGVVLDLGTRWGQNLALFSALRGIYEPFNRHRKLIGFDTFTGFPDIHDNDGNSNLMKKGNVSCTDGYEQYLDQIMRLHEKHNPASHIKKYEIIKGDACEKMSLYLKENPETIVVLAYFDFDIYEPTKKCLELILPRLGKGSILGFDELNDHDSPGETVALMEALDIRNVRIQRCPYVARTSYIVME